MTSIAEIIAEFEKDPVMAKELHAARVQLEALKTMLGEECFRDLLLSHFINVEDLNK